MQTPTQYPVKSAAVLILPSFLLSLRKEIFIKHLMRNFCDG
jgi:hypothetical protein